MIPRRILHRALTSSFGRPCRQLVSRSEYTRDVKRYLGTGHATSVSAVNRANNHARHLSTTTGSSTPQTGFSYPGPRKLDEVVKIQLLNKHGAPRVREIWNEYHKDHKTAIGDVLSAEEYGLLKGRAQRCKHFVLPVPRDGGYFTLLVQFQGKQCFMTYLEDYKLNAPGAQPYLTLTFFEELLDTKGVVLLRGEVTSMLTRQEAKVLTELVKMYYLGHGKSYDTLVAFNEASDKFDFKTVLGAAGIR